jgi:hypothetical protein
MCVWVKASHFVGWDGVTAFVLLIGLRGVWVTDAMITLCVTTPF